MKLRFLIPLLFATSLWASCPASVPSGITTCFYADFVSGSDSANGTTETTPWKHFPGMPGCASNCSANSPGPGDGYILKGGVTWPAASLPWAWNWSGSSTGSTPGCTGSGCIYVGVDPTWYTGSAWARPILNNGGSTGNANQSIINIGEPGNYLIFDNVELTGFYWNGSVTYGTANVSLPGGEPNIGAHDTLTHLYIHGWTHGTSGSGTNEDACGVTGDSSDTNGNVGTILEYSVISGADTDQASCNGAVFGGPPYIAYNLMEYVPSCMVIDGPMTVHDNICQNVVHSFDAGAHENGLEINYVAYNTTVYNNIIRHLSGSGALTFWVQPKPGTTAYVFNNVFYDTDSGNVIDLASQSEYYSGSAGTTIMWNNTVECGPDSNPDAVCASGIGAGVTAVTFQNNHWITNAGSFWSSSGPTPTLHNNILQTLSTANGQGYNSSQTYAFSPSSSGNATVGAGLSATSLCSASGVGAACGNDTAYGVAYNSTNHTVSTPGRTTNIWASPPDSSAYQFSSGSTYVITVSSITGNGTVTSSDSVINCTTGTAGTCVDSSASGTVTLTATPATGYAFSSWGGSCSGSGSCSVNTTATVTATFTQLTAATPTFSPTSLSSPGRVTISCSTSGATGYYTVDASGPTTSSAIADHPLYLGQSQALKAMCAATGYINSTVATQAYSFAMPKTRFSLLPASTSVNPPILADNRPPCCSGTQLASLCPSRGGCNWTALGNWITQSQADGANLWWTIQSEPTWMTGLTDIRNAPPTDLSTSATCQAPIATVTDNACMIQEVAASLAEYLTGLSSVPATPVSCSAKLYEIDEDNEYNTEDGTASSGVGWNGTTAQLATMGYYFNKQFRKWCSDVILTPGSVSGIVGGGTSNPVDFDTATQAVLAAWPQGQKPDAVALHTYPARQTVINVPFPTSITSNNSSSCTGTSNVNCYMPVSSMVSQFNTTTVLQNSANVAWSKYLPVLTDEDGFGELQQLCGPSSCSNTDTQTVFLRTAWVAQSNIVLAVQNPAAAMYYLGYDPTGSCGSTAWGCYWALSQGPTVNSGWYAGFLQTNSWLNACSITGALSSTAVSGGNVWKVPLNCSGSTAEFAWFDGYLTNSVQSVTFNAQQDIHGNITSTGGSATLTQSPVLLYNAIQSPRGLSGTVAASGAEVEIQ